MTRKFRFDDPQNLKERLEDAWEHVRRSPRRLKYWYREKFTRTTIKITTLHGGWWDTDAKLLHANFQLLTDYVEVELANMYDVCDLTNHGSPGAKTPREKGEAYLLHIDARQEDDGTSWAKETAEHYKEQKEKELKVLELYRWWKDVRPARIEVYDTPEYKSFETFEPFHFEDLNDGSKCSRMVTNTTDARYPDYRDMMEKSRQQDADWENEDTERLIQLIIMRHNLWT